VVAVVVLAVCLRGAVHAVRHLPGRASGHSVQEQGASQPSPASQPARQEEEAAGARIARSACSRRRLGCGTGPPAPAACPSCTTPRTRPSGKGPDGVEAPSNIGAEQQPSAAPDTPSTVAPAPTSNIPIHTKMMHLRLLASWSRRGEQPVRSTQTQRTAHLSRSFDVAPPAWLQSGRERGGGGD
jgi:hypothetical protein